MKTPKYRVYALYHPNGSIFYIGQTKQDTRFYQHLSIARSDTPGKRSDVIRAILAQNLKPTYRVLCYVENQAEADYTDGIQGYINQTTEKWLHVQWSDKTSSLVLRANCKTIRKVQLATLKPSNT